MTAAEQSALPAGGGSGGGRSPRGARIPGATYRLQLGANLTFRDARDLVPYLADLGVTDCYLSPILETCAPDSHGYDVANHGQLNLALGGEAAYEALADALRTRGMGQLVDVVPNHMGIARGRNGWWQDVLENGAASPFASFFDIDWEPPKPELRNQVLLPILEAHYGRVLENQGLRLHYEDGAFLVRYHDWVLPISPCTYPQILTCRLPELEEALGRDDPQVRELQSIAAAAARLPARTETEPERQAERARQKEVVKRRLDTLTREAPGVKGFVDETLWLFNGVPGRPDSFDRLDALLSAQAYRVAYWGVAGDEINYRRFFDINDLAAIRMEDPAVFEAAHRLLFRLIREGRITGLRIDHPDGLYAPAGYLGALQERCGGEHSGAPEEPPAARPFYVVVEKVLMPAESLPAHWPVHGTTGYELLNALNGLFVDPRGVRSLDQTYQRFTGLTAPFVDVVHEAKRLVTDTTMASELNVLGRRLGRLAEQRRESRDFTGRSLTEGLREIISCFPVYRTYVGDDGQAAGVRDRDHVAAAVAAAKRRSPATNASVFDFIKDLLCRTGDLDFVRRFQQLTGPVTAKGVEDTAFYRYNRLLSLNEVGGAPDHFGTPAPEFHRLNAERLARWPHSLSATSTHDTKRSEDVRARINVLSELPLEWRVRLRTWHRLNRRHRTLVDGHPAPDPNEEYLLYQTLIGAWPMEPAPDAEHAVFVERIQQLMLKSLREAKVHASWVNPHPAYDAAVVRFVAAILDRAGPPRRAPGRLRRLIGAIVTEDDGNPFLADFLAFQQRVAEAGIYNSLAQTLLKLVLPGVPDTYQGTETWDMSLVDPDNRRPVDYARLRADLDAIRRTLAQPDPDIAGLARSLLDTRTDGRIKLYVTHRALDSRRRRPGLFAEGAYLPLETQGHRREHVVAIGRERGREAAISVVPRFIARLHLTSPPLGPSVWGGTWLALPETLASRAYRNVLTGEAVPVVTREGRPGLALETALAILPVALLEATDVH
ncbi:MAG TPA: malto-oligosyltrehalose synthase [Methylomirabilota bacterium]|nr:malto-oligosyltrehalose synthase [Methylomirabilota bacterium]